MEAEIGNAAPHAGAEQVLPGQDAMPGAKESVVLVMDSLLTILQLFKTEAALALKNLPALLALDMYRIPAHLLTWISFCTLAACIVQAVTENLLLSVGLFFLLQLALTLLLERRARQLARNVSFPESRKGLALVIASLKDRFQQEGKVSG